MVTIRQRFSDRSTRSVDGWESYDQRFQDSEAVSEYDKIYSGKGSFEADLWTLAIPTVRELIERFRPAAGPYEVLDFACGTGRISEVVETCGVGVVGVDISAAMLDVATSRCPRSTFVAGDLTSPAFRAEHGLHDFDLALAFRFFLNAQPELKVAALAAIRSVVKPGGHLIVNNHRSSPSLHALWILLKRRLGRGNDNVMNRRAFEAMLSDGGFEIVARIGYHVLHGAIYRSRLAEQSLRVDARILDDAASPGSRRWPQVVLGRFGADQIYVCRAVS